MKTRDLHAQGYSIAKIWERTGLSRNTVKKYLRGDPVGRPRQRRGSKLDPYKSQLDGRYELLTEKADSSYISLNL